MIIHPSTFGFYARNYWTATLLSIVLFAAGIFMAFQGQIEIAAALIVVAIIIVVVGIGHSVIHHKHTSLSLTESEVVYETGMLNHRKIRAPIQMITDSQIKRTFVEKLVGISDLYINTSGGAHDEIVANDFESKEVEAMHDEIYRLIRQMHTQKK
ncbi:MAG: PH domain-containing protein [Candidatus Micrarchaeia archaeon]